MEALACTPALRALDLSRCALAPATLLQLPRHCPQLQVLRLGTSDYCPPCADVALMAVDVVTRFTALHSMGRSALTAVQGLMRVSRVADVLRRGEHSRGKISGQGSEAHCAGDRASCCSHRVVGAALRSARRPGGRQAGEPASPGVAGLPSGYTAAAGEPVPQDPGQCVRHSLQNGEGQFPIPPPCSTIDVPLPPSRDPHSAAPAPRWSSTLRRVQTRHLKMTVA